MPESKNDTSPPGYRLITAEGPPRELGRQHGLQATEAIHAFLAYLGATLGLSREMLARRALRFEPLFAEYCPHLLDEVAGLAEGARIPFGEALALQLRGELAGVGDEACTAFVIGPAGTADGHVLIGQNSDTPAELREFAYVLRLVPEDRPALLIWTFGGMLGYHGLNAHGVGHFANALGGGPAWKFALSHYPLKRMMLECRSLAEVNALVRRVPVCSNGNYVLCDGSGAILDLELTTEGPLPIADAGAGFIVHSNHFLCAPHSCTANFEKSLADSFPRLERIRALVQERFGRITVADMQAILADHAGHPVGICRHPHEGAGDPVLPASGRTVAGLVAEPARGLLHVARGNPCENRFHTYRLDAGA